MGRCYSHTVKIIIALRQFKTDPFHQDHQAQTYRTNNSPCLLKVFQSYVPFAYYDALAGRFSLLSQAALNKAQCFKLQQAGLL